SHRLDGPVVCRLVGLRGLARPRHLADVLQRRRTDLVVGGRRCEVVELTDVAAHGSTFAPRTPGPPAVSPIVGGMPDVLIDPPELARQLASDDAEERPILLDVRWALARSSEGNREDYLAGHIPGAAFLDLESGLS